MIRLILIVIVVAIVLAMLLRRKQPSSRLTEIRSIGGKDQASPALRAGDEDQEIVDRQSGAGDGISEKE